MNHGCHEKYRETYDTLKDRFLEAHSQGTDPEVFGTQLYEFVLENMKKENPEAVLASTTLKNMSYIELLS